MQGSTKRAAVRSPRRARESAKAKLATALALVGLGSGLVLAPQRADAFCGFYVSGADAELFNNATQVVLMRDGQRTVLSIQNNYQGPPSDFAMVVPVPVVLKKESVKTLPREVFGRVDQLTAPRLVEYWEQDPCAPMPPPMPMMAMRGSGGAPGAARPRKSADLGVKIEAKFTVGEYKILILSARDSGGLDTWLRRENYKIPKHAEPLLRPYVQQGMKFFVAKVDVKKVKFERGMATLSPLRFHYDSKDFRLPVRLGLINSGGTQDLIVNVLARGQRYEVANYPNVTIPTNFDVKDAAKASFGSFYASLFDRTLEAHPGAVITEYSWDSGSCDPCPTPALSFSELATLGADVLAPASGPGSAPPPPPGGPPGGVRRRPMPSMWMPSGFVVTRMHVRYGKSSLGEDLVFRAAPPITGGREVKDADGKLEHGSKPGSVNNFQGRYAIRHPWTGPIQCDNPRRGIWGGPPGGGTPKPMAAQDLAFAKRSTGLASFVSGPIPGLGAAALAPPPSASSAPAPSASAPAPSAETAPKSEAVPPRGSSGGCGSCTVGRSSSLSFGALAAFGLLGISALRRRRKR